MRTALFLLLLLAIAAVPGSLVPQRSADPNGVIAVLQPTTPTSPRCSTSSRLFDVYTSAWFSAIYLLLFISLIGCVIPRTKHHLEALRAAAAEDAGAPRAAGRLHRRATPAGSGCRRPPIDSARAHLLRKAGYRVAAVTTARGELSVSAERGYLRETGNLVFHTALVGMLHRRRHRRRLRLHRPARRRRGPDVRQRARRLRLVQPRPLLRRRRRSQPYSHRARRASTSTYEPTNLDALGAADRLHRRRHDARAPGERAEAGDVKVNDPLDIGGTEVYLLGNGYAPTITVRDPDGKVVFTDSVPFLPQDANLTSLGVVKVPDGLAEQLGMVGFFYPTASQLDHGRAHLGASPTSATPCSPCASTRATSASTTACRSRCYALDTDEHDPARRRHGADAARSS